MKISQLLEQKPGTVIPSVSGTIKKLFAPREGKGAYGPYCYHDGVLQDGKDEVFVSFRFRMDDESEGKFLFLNSVKNKKGILTGLTFIEDSYTNNDGEDVTKHVLTVTKSASVTFGNAGSSACEEEPEPPIDDEEPKRVTKPAKKPTAAQPEDNEIPGAESPKANVKQAAEAIERFAGLYELCILRAAKTIPWFERQFEEDMTPEQFQAYCSALFISAERSGLAKKLPRNAASFLSKPPEDE